MPQANALRVGLLMGGALVIRSSRLVVAAGTACCFGGGFSKVVAVGRVGLVTLLGPEGTGICLKGVGFFGRLGLGLPGLVVVGSACGPFLPVIPHRPLKRVVSLVGVGVGGGCGRGSVRVLRTA